MKRIFRYGVATAALVLSLSAADAATVNVSGAGFFGPDTPTTPESMPGQTFSFSFITQDPIPGNPDEQIINPMFSLSGQLVSPTITSVTFGNDSNGGLFDLLFSDNRVLSFYGAAINTDGYLQSGSYLATVGLNGGSPIGDGLVAVSIAVSSVPLPGSAPMFGCGMLALGAVTLLMKRMSGSRLPA